MRRAQAARPERSRLRRDGGFYFTDLGKRRAREIDVGGVYYAKRDGSTIVEVAYPLLTPNGIGLSPDGKTLYVAETETARLWAFDIAEPGVVKKAPLPLAAWRPHRRRPGRLSALRQPGGRSRGRICVATLITGAITVDLARRPPVEPDKPARPDDHQHLLRRRRIMKTAFITLSWTGRLVALDWPEPGLPLAFPR